MGLETRWVIHRPLILTGDGGFQMTGVEIAHAPRYRLNPIVVLLNNGGWGIFRPVVKRQDLLALPSWLYAELARLWAAAVSEWRPWRSCIARWNRRPSRRRSRSSRS
jgi:TPP-dependent 2-oxoacid decarboxylase